MARDPPDLKTKSLSKKKTTVTENQEANVDNKKAPSLRQLIKNAFQAIKNDYEIIIAYIIVFLMMG